MNTNMQVQLSKYFSSTSLKWALLHKMLDTDSYAKDMINSADIIAQRSVFLSFN